MSNRTLQAFAFTVSHATMAGVSAYLFYKIHPTAGLMMVPFTLWASLYAVFAYKTLKPKHH
jgi:tryptophan-rich sensory protein